MAQKYVGGCIHGFHDTRAYSCFQYPSNLEREPLNNAIVKENVDHETKEIDDTQGTENNHTRHCFLGVYF